MYSVLFLQRGGEIENVGIEEIRGNSPVEGSVAGCRGINNSTLANVLPSCTETEHSQQEVLTLTQMSSPATTDTNATQHPDTTRPGNASKRADSAHKQPTGRLRQHAFTSAPLSAFLRRITRLTTERELRTPRVPAIQQQSQPASQLVARARSRDSCLRHALWCSFPQPQNQSTTTFLPVVSERHEHHRDDNKRKDTFISYEFSYHFQICCGSYILQFGSTYDILVFSKIELQHFPKRLLHLGKTPFPTHRTTTLSGKISIPLWPVLTTEVTTSLVQYELISILLIRLRPPG